MSMQNIKQTAEDQYLDLIIRLAYEQIADQEVEKLLNEPDPELTNEEKTTGNKAFRDALSEEDTRRKHEKKRQSTKHFRHMLVKVCEVAACLIIIIGIAFPIAIATSAQFRSKVMQLLINIDTVNNEAHFSFIEDENAAFYVPEGWNGEWYMSYIPSDLSLTQLHEFMQYVEYSDGDMRKLGFSEMDEEYGVMIGTENANIQDVMIGGQIGCMIIDNSEDHAIAIIWSCENKWFKLSSFQISQEEMIAVAENVRKIIR